jgi:hypothetical protein
MVSEMDILKMNDRQRIAWLQANRLTLMFVGLAWLGMIIWEFIQGNIPVFLLVMVPFFAIFRFLSYRRYKQPTRQKAA